MRIQPSPLGNNLFQKGAVKKPKAQKQKSFLSIEEPGVI